MNVGLTIVTAVMSCEVLFKASNMSRLARPDRNLKHKSIFFYSVIAIAAIKQDLVEPGWIGRCSLSTGSRSVVCGVYHLAR